MLVPWEFLQSLSFSVDIFEKESELGKKNKKYRRAKLTLTRRSKNKNSSENIFKKRYFYEKKKIKNKK